MPYEYMMYVNSMSLYFLYVRVINFMSVLISFMYRRKYIKCNEIEGNEKKKLKFIN